MLEKNSFWHYTVIVLCHLEHSWASNGSSNTMMPIKETPPNLNHHPLSSVPMAASAFYKKNKEMCLKGHFVTCVKS